MKQQVTAMFKSKKGRVEKECGDVQVWSLPIAHAGWFYDTRDSIPFQVLCHGEGPISKPRHKQRVEFAIWWNIPLGVQCPHCGKAVKG